MARVQSKKSFITDLKISQRPKHIREDHCIKTLIWVYRSLKRLSREDFADEIDISYHTIIGWDKHDYSFTENAKKRYLDFLEKVVAKDAEYAWLYNSYLNNNYEQKISEIQPVQRFIDESVTEKIRLTLEDASFTIVKIIDDSMEGFARGQTVAGRLKPFHPALDVDQHIGKSMIFKVRGMCLVRTLCKNDDGEYYLFPTNWRAGAKVIHNPDISDWAPITYIMGEPPREFE